MIENRRKCDTVKGSVTYPSMHLSQGLRSALILSFALSLFLIGCANPVPPSGGPRDETPPSVVTSRPEDGAVNVDRQSIYIEFSEYVDRASFEQALSVTPHFERTLEIDWGGDEVEIEFPEALRDSTTYIITIDTNFRDERGVQLNAPITIAFSTGSTINQGTLSGTVRGAAEGTPQEGVDVYAYATRTVPDTLPDQPNYRTQTGEDGTFTFDYLTEQPYYVIALRDDNRNRRPDPPEPFAAPPQPLIPADSQAAPVEAPWVLARRDTIPPELVRVQTRSQRRLTLRFNEPVRSPNRAPDRWALRDSVRDASVPVEAVYQRPGNAATLDLRTAAMRPNAHRLIVPRAAVTDSVGNALPADTARFVASSASDTLQTRFRTFMPTGLSPDTTGLYTLWPTERPGLRFNQAVDTSALRGALTVQQPDEMPRAYDVTSDDGTIYRLTFTPPLQAGETIQLRLDGALVDRPDTTFTRRFQLLPDRQRGALSGAIARADTTDSTAAGRFIAEVFMIDSDRFAPRRTMADTTGAFTFTDLPEGTYRFRAFFNRNGNEQWNPGTLTPYQPPEPITWSSGTIDNRPRWDNVLEDTLRIPHTGR